MQFVNEQNRVLGPADLVHDSLDPFFELPSVFGSGNHHGEVEHHDPTVGQQFGYVPLNHPLGKALDDRGLADPRLANQHRVVFGTATENLNGPLDLLLAADHRVKFALLGQFSEITTERVERRRFALAALGRGVAATAARSSHLASTHA